MNEAELRAELELERKRNGDSQRVARLLSGLNAFQKRELHMLNRAIVKKNKRIRILQERLKKVAQ